MATKSFLTEFKFSAKSGKKIVDAIENSKTREHVLQQKVEIVRDTGSINNLMDSFLGARKN
ncbi:hypothetical protein U5N28_18680 [Lysinibacillus telephonicus]|uniref:Uncharacterized protein n=1 Tax=Lysinibacillus telephonicus TaxID=1714840 RepID=A0A3S0HNE3_9BACI|nr:hypothetical protein [Lysinibacillus telephonicus]RTQ95614.1 hypothetical protein EKG35_02715 [Lysinibacillus telephonicus]